MNMIKKKKNQQYHKHKGQKIKYSPKLPKIADKWVKINFFWI